MQMGIGRYLRKNNHYPIDFLPQLRYPLSVASKQPYGEIAQLVEQAAHIRSVRGPSPFLARVPEILSGIFHFLAYRIPQDPQPFDLYLDYIALLHPGNPAWRTCRDDITWQQRHHVREV